MFAHLEKFYDICDYSQILLGNLRDLDTITRKNIFSILNLQEIEDRKLFLKTAFKSIPCNSYSITFNVTNIKTEKRVYYPMNKVVSIVDILRNISNYYGEEIPEMLRKQLILENPKIDLHKISRNDIVPREGGLITTSSVYDMFFIISKEHKKKETDYELFLEFSEG